MRRKGSKNINKAKTGKPRGRCHVCGKRVYIGSLAVVGQAPIGNFKHSTSLSVPKRICFECRQFKIVQ